MSDIITTTLINQEDITTSLESLEAISTALSNLKGITVGLDTFVAPSTVLFIPVGSDSFITSDGDTFKVREAS